MMKWILAAVLILASIGLRADDGSALGLESPAGGTGSFEGVVTALGPNADDPEHTFTAISDDGTAKVFRIKSLENLDVGDRVSLQYREGDVYPMEVTTISFKSDSDSSGK